jgi:sterol desaturase/sphingolipid hydroxylase (fatty acid hydroxylase superfamily)
MGNLAYAKAFANHLPIQAGGSREAHIDSSTAIAWASAQGQTMASALGAAYAALLAPLVIFTVFGLLRRRGQFGPWRTYLGEARVTLAMMAANAILAAPVLALVALAIIGAAAATDLRLIDPAVWKAAPPWLMIICVVVAGDFIGYWRHRFEHGRLLWPAHATHHSDTAMTWLTLERFHPINSVTTYAIDTAALVALGFPVEALIANGLVRHWYGYWIHMDAPWTYGKFGRIFVSPAMHGWHHAADPRAHCSNFATVFSIWDQMFGTFYVPGPRPAEMGVPGVSGASALAHLAYPGRPTAYCRHETTDRPRADSPDCLNPDPSYAGSGGREAAKAG